MSERNMALEKALGILDLLMDHFTEGLTPMEIAKATGMSPPAVTRAIHTLRDTGHAEQMPENGRWRASHELARKATYILQSLDTARRRTEESLARITRT
uniref:IclR helix-turn-helix domain-containing protein n=2 Tax=unclassified Candidatus Kentrum TaxID=2643149 RepID=A0A451AU86_9GAMM|nr:MAG: IclR helix-turn-helix domain-containing protein [Candidatus Kentron sp. LPFa]VFK69616.1 MAG: IclR helix-turn-helix domain-containing protein [Candidatus Kentron sp. UNK]VFK73978.1 MAG: IclR helix-turn-helix domain-containing protein [Candidatus Kentron sp. UNK]